MNNKCGQNENRELEYNYKTFIGVDEVGRGSLAGPVIAAAVFVKKDQIGEISGINDSKKISKKERERLYSIITSRYRYSFGIVNNKTIDKINILKASLLAMKKAVLGLSLKGDVIMVDGIYKIPNLEDNQITHKRGDQLFYSIAAASIIAKVKRDKIMTEYSSKYINYSFYKHSGYGTQKHKEEIIKNGLSNIHRKSFKIDLKTC